MKDRHELQTVIPGQTTTVTLGNAGDMLGNPLPYVVYIDGRTFYADDTNAVMRFGFAVGQQKGVPAAENMHLNLVAWLREIYDYQGAEVTILNIVRPEVMRQPVMVDEAHAKQIYRAAKKWAETRKDKPFTLPRLAYCISDPDMYRLVED